MAKSKKETTTNEDDREVVKLDVTISPLAVATSELRRQWSGRAFMKYLKALRDEKGNGKD